MTGSMPSFVAGPIPRASDRARERARQRAAAHLPPEPELASRKRDRPRRRGPSLPGLVAALVGALLAVTSIGAVPMAAADDASPAPEAPADPPQSTDQPTASEPQPTDAPQPDEPKADQPKPQGPDAAAEPERRSRGGSDGRPRRSAAEESPDPTPKPTPTPWPTPPGVKGLDVSHWNPVVDFERAAQLGVRFVFAKASQGVTMRDELYPVHTGAARAAGMAVGAYHFFDYRKAGREQARHFLATLRATTGLAGLLPLVVDVETLSTLGTPNKTKARERLHALLDELYRQTGRYPMIYTSRYMWRQVVGEPLGFGSYPLWVACWKCDTVWLPRGWSSWRFWQFGEFRFGNGLPRLDGNVYAGGPTRLLRERQRSVRLADGAAWARTSEVVADLRGYQGKHVRVALDDRAFGAWRPFEPSLGIDLGKKQGQRRVRFQLRSFRLIRGPVFEESILLDTVAPKVRGPVLGITEGARVSRSAGRVPMRAAMTASDATSGLERSVLVAICDGVRLARSASPTAGPELEADLKRTGCTVRASATDQVGHDTARQLDPRVELVDMRRRSERLTFRGVWQSMRRSTAVAGTLLRTADAGATASLRFEGAQFAIVARRSPGSGKLDVIVDAELVARVDLYAGATEDRRLVFVGNVPTGAHTLRLRASGLSDDRATGSAVTIDAVLVLDRRR